MAGNHKPQFKAKTHRKGTKIDLAGPGGQVPSAFADVEIEGQANAIQASLSVFISPLQPSPSNPPSSFSLLTTNNKNDTVANVKGIADYTPYDEGIHTLVLVVFDKAPAASNDQYRFIMHKTEGIHVIP